jgi:chromosome segregation ATPase
MCKKLLLLLFLSYLLVPSVSAQDGSAEALTKASNPYLDPEASTYQISSDEIKILLDCLTTIQIENEKVTSQLNNLKTSYNLSLLTVTELQSSLNNLEQKHRDLLQQSENLESRIQTLLTDLQTSNNQLKTVNNSLTELLAERDELTKARDELWTSYEQYKAEVTTTIQTLQNEKIIVGVLAGLGGIILGFVVGSLAF